MKPQIKEILTSTARIHGVPVRGIVSQNRQKSIVVIRDDFIRRARYYGFSHPEIGASIGRDPSTITHSIHKTGATIGREYQ